MRTQTVTRTVTSCTRTRTVGNPGGRRDEARYRELAKMVDLPWTLRVDGTELNIRRSTELDLPAVAYMHRRCSARSLLERYRAGGRQPAVIALDQQLRRPLSYVAEAGNGTIVATVAIRADLSHPGSAEVGILVEDGWQRRGIGTELIMHAAGAAAAAGFTELVAYPGPEPGPAQRLMIGIGRTWMIPDDDDMHLHTALKDTAIHGLGAVRSLLVG